MNLGDRLGVYLPGLAEAGPLAPAELAVYTGTAERYVREWLTGQTAVILTGPSTPVRPAGTTSDHQRLDFDVGSSPSGGGPKWSQSSRARANSSSTSSGTAAANSSRRNGIGCSGAISMSTGRTPARW